MKRVSRRIPRRQLPLVAYQLPQLQRENGRSASERRRETEPRMDPAPQVVDQILHEVFSARPGELFGDSNKPRYGTLVLNDGEEIPGFWSVCRNGSYEGFRSKLGSAESESRVWLENFPACQVRRLELIKPTVEEA